MRGALALAGKTAVVVVSIIGTLVGIYVALWGGSKATSLVVDFEPLEFVQDLTIEVIVRLPEDQVQAIINAVQ